MTQRKKVSAKTAKGFRTSEHPAKRMTQLLKLPLASRVTRLHDIVRSDSDRYALVAKRRAAALSDADSD